MDAKILQARMLIEQRRKALTDHANSKKQSAVKTEINNKEEVSTKRVIPIAEAEESPITIKRIDTNIPLIKEHINDPLAQNKKEITNLESNIQEQGKIIYKVSEKYKSVITIETLQEDVKVENNDWEDIEDVAIVDIAPQDNEITNSEEAIEVERGEVQEEININIEDNAIEEVIKKQDKTLRKFKVGYIDDECR